jgi:hypothetical protein
LLGFFENMIGRLFDAGHFVAGILRRMDQLIELELKRERIPILRGLNEKIITTEVASRNVDGLPESRAVPTASFPNQPAVGEALAEVFAIGRFARIPSAAAR